MYPYSRMPVHITALYLYSVLNCIALLHLTLVDADVIVVKEGSNASQEVYSDIPAHFGIALPDAGLKGYVLPAKPNNACSPIEPPPNNTNPHGHWIVLIRRYGCTFADKVRMAQEAGYDAAIIRNVNSNNLDPMAGPRDDDDISIPSVFIGERDGLEIENKFIYNKGYFIIMIEEFDFNLTNYLLPFAVVVCLSFITMLIFMLIKCIKDHRRLSRYRLPRSSLRKIPTKKFKKGDPYDVCAICLEEYIEGEKLRILPCAHAYHCKCVDPWLTKTRRVCPCCKRKILYNGEHFSDSEPDSDNEQAPLLQPGNYGTQGGTFMTGRGSSPVISERFSVETAAELSRTASGMTAVQIEGSANEGYTSSSDDDSDEAEGSEDVCVITGEANQSNDESVVV
ncbi:E3 ubiquitin-protein ligase RNF13-like isoform X2 [Artemia franciscana]|uniref:E3 ubiquitin-protein ligase RNF13-like isoform X2 n=1 Tax=Artemia franciscana TaxID=6661 RepID=UPI0032DB295F